MGAHSNAALFGNIAYKLFWGQPLTTDDHTDILQYGEDVLKTFREESDDFTKSLMQPLEALMAKLKPLLSEKSNLFLERITKILSTIVRALYGVMNINKPRKHAH